MSRTLFASGRVPAPRDVNGFFPFDVLYDEDADRASKALRALAAQYPVGGKAEVAQDAGQDLGNSVHASALVVGWP